MKESAKVKKEIETQKDMPEDSQKAPVTVKEYIVQLEARFDGFEKLIEEKFLNVNNNIERVAKAVEATVTTKADKEDFDELKREFNEHKENAVTKTEFKIGLGVVTTILTVAVTILTIWEKMKG